MLMLPCRMYAAPDGRERSVTVTPVLFSEPIAGPALPLTTHEIVPPTFRAGDTRPPRWDMISAEPSGPSRRAVASRALTRRQRPGAGSYEEDRGGAGYDAPDVAVPVRAAINVQLARVARGQPRLLQSTRTAGQPPVQA